MKTEPNDLAYPFVETGDMRGESVNLGLTKREYFAAMAMQAFIGADPDSAYVTIADEAVKYADALIERLNK